MESAFALLKRLFKSQLSWNDLKITKRLYSLKKAQATLIFGNIYYLCLM